MYILRRDPGVTEWITEVAAHPEGFGFLVKRHWWKYDSDDLATDLRDQVLSGLDAAEVGEIAHSGVWRDGPDAKPAQAKIGDSRTAAASRVVVRNSLPPFEVTVTLPSGHAESIGEPMSTQEYLSRCESPIHMLTTNNPAGTSMVGWNRTRDVDADGTVSRWEHNEVTITIWCDRLPSEGAVIVAAQFEEFDTRSVRIDGASVLSAAAESMPLFDYAQG